MRNRRFATHLDRGIFVVRDAKTDAVIYRGTPDRFVYGCPGYDERTRRFPQYVHEQLWHKHGMAQRAATFTD